MGWNLRLPPTALAAFAAGGASPLTRLDLSFCGQMGDQALELVAQLPALQSLSLRKCSRVSDVVGGRGGPGGRGGAVQAGLVLLLLPRSLRAGLCKPG